MKKRVQTVPNDRPKRKVIFIFNSIFVVLLMLLIVYPIIFFIPPHDKLDEFVKIPFFEGLVKLTYPFIFTPFKIDASSFVNFSENYLAFLSFYLWYLVFVALLFLLYISFICLNINR